MLKPAGTGSAQSAKGSAGGATSPTTVEEPAGAAAQFVAFVVFTLGLPDLSTACYYYLIEATTI
jgi:hypothetical protein